MLKSLFLLCLLLQTLFSSSLITLNSYEQAIKQAKKENKRVLMMIYSKHCPWCTKMKQTTLSNPDVIEFITKDYVFLSLIRKKESYPKHFTPRFIPTTYLIDPHTQEEIYALYGYKTSAEFLYELHDE